MLPGRSDDVAPLTIVHRHYYLSKFHDLVMALKGKRSDSIPIEPIVGERVFRYHFILQATDGSTTVKLGVSKAAIIIASSIWKTAVDANEAKWRAEAIFGDLPLLSILSGEHNIEALRVVLQIAHLQFRKVPESLPVKQLIEVAKLVVKYETYDLVRMYAAGWLQDHKDEDSFDEEGAGDCIWVGWAFDRKTILRGGLVNFISDTAPIWVVHQKNDLPPGCEGQTISSS